MKRLLFILMTGLALIAPISTAWAVQDGQGNEIQPLGTSGQFRVTNSNQSSKFVVVDEATGNVGIGDTAPASLLTVGSGDLFQVNSSGDIIRIDNVTYDWPASQGGASTVLTNNGTGVLSWTAASAGDITSVGDVTSGAAFDGTSGNTLIFEGSSADGNETTVLAADPGADFTITIPAVTGVLVTTGDTGSVTGTMILNGTVASTDITDNTITGTDTADDTFDFVDFEDTLDLDADLILNQATNAWSQTFTGTTQTGLTYTASSLTTGTGVSVASAATGLAGDLTKIELTGANTGNSGNVLKVGYTGTTGTATAVNVTNAGTGLTFRVNDDGTYTDATSFVVDATGNVGIGDTTPASLFTVGASDVFQVDSSGDIVRIQNVTYDWPASQGGASTVLTNNGTGVLSWTAASTGDITSVGDVTSGAAFDGTSGNTLIFEGSTPDGNEITFAAADPGADFTITIPAVTGVLVTTGDTGSVTGTMILNGTVASTDITDNTITGTDTADDTFDFVDFEDTLDLDADLVLNQATNAWSQTFTGTTQTGLTYTASSLTTGTGVNFTSAATGLTGDLHAVELTGANTGNTGNVLKVGYTGTTGTATAVNVTNAGTGLTFRVNDDGTYTDATSFVVDATGNVGIGDTTPASLFTVGASDVFQVDSTGDIVRIQNVTYDWPASQGGASTVLTNNGTGVLSWTAASAGDITSVGDVTSGAAFDGTSGNTLIFEGSTPDGNEITFAAADPGADFTITIPAVTGVLVTTGDTGSVTGTMILNGTVASTDITDNTITGTDTADDTFDFVDFEDTLDLDADLVLNQSTNAWSQTFTGTTQTGLTYTASSLTTGTGVSVASAATGLAGDLTKIELTGANTGNSGNVLKVGYTGTTGTATAVNVTNAGTGLSFRVNDNGTYTDTTPVVVDGSGNVGIGTSTPATALQVSGAITVTPTTTQTLSAGTAITPDSTYVRIQSSGGDVNLTANPQITAGTTAGQMLVIVGVSETDRVQLDNGTGVRLSGAVSFTMGNQDTITLIFDGTNWVELSRVNNPST